MIRWGLNNSYFIFGSWKLNKKNKTTMNGFGLFIATGKRIFAANVKHDRINGEGRRCSASEKIYEGHFKDD
jgi:hypothetical protein